MADTPVKAGALCAIFSTPEQLAAQTSNTITLFSRTGNLPGPQYPVLYSIDVNQEVARTLGINLNSVESLHVQIDKSSRSQR